MKGLSGMKVVLFATLEWGYLQFLQVSLGGLVEKAKWFMMVSLIRCVGENETWKKRETVAKITEYGGQLFLSRLEDFKFCDHLNFTDNFSNHTDG